MIDFHTHILPGMDDGSRSVEQSLEMLNIEARQGITGVVLSSHFYADENNIDAFLQRRQAAFDRLAQQYSKDMPRLYLGAEVQYFEGIGRCDDLSRLCISGTDLLLLEMPMTPWSKRMVDDVIQLNKRSDIRIVIAHLDRYFDCQPKALWRRLVDVGFLIQINTSAFRHFRSRMIVMNMLKRGQVHFLGTDCHGVHSRSPEWTKVPDKVKELLGSNTFLQSAESTIL